MIIEIIAVLIALLGTAYFSYTDIKTGYLPDGPMHLMVLTGVVVAGIRHWGDFSGLLENYAIALAVFGFFFVLYSLGQFGGGDTKLYTALTLLIPYYPQQLASVSGVFGIVPQTMAYPFIISLFIISVLASMIFLPFDMFRKILRVKNKVENYDKKIIQGLLFSAFVIPLTYIWYSFASWSAILMVPLFFGMFIYPFKDDFVKHLYAEKKLISKLDDDDVLALEVISESTKKKLGLWRKTFTMTELKGIKKKAKKAGIKYTTVCENMSKFVPYIFIALVLNLLLGDTVVWLLVNSF